MAESLDFPGKYVSIISEEDGHEVVACATSVERDAYQTLWRKEDKSPITIAADCAGIGSGIEGVAKVCEDHSVEFISEIDDATREVCTLFAKPEDVRSNVLLRHKKRDVHSDVYIAGFPCQPFSAAGKREGFNDSKGRGRICYRLIEHIQHALPKVFILENVKGLKDANEGRDYCDFVERLKRIKNYDTNESAYLVSSMFLNANGSPQSRLRVYFVGIRRDYLININAALR